MKSLKKISIVMLLVSFVIRGFAQMTIASGYYCTTGGSVQMNMQGNLSNSGTFEPPSSGSSTVTFSGTAGTITIGGTGLTKFQNAVLNNSSSANHFASAGNISVLSTLTLTSGVLDIGTNNLTTDSISHGSSASYIATTSTGALTLNSVGSSFALLPIGPSTSSYTPLTLTNTTSTPNITAGVGTSITNAVADTSKIVDLQWSVLANTGTPTSTIGFNWNSTGNEASSFVTAGGHTSCDLANWVSSYTISSGITPTNPSGSAWQISKASLSIPSTGSNLYVIGAVGAIVVSNTIATSNVSGPYCAGSAITVNFTATGTFTTGNVYTAQLSDSSGSFGTPSTIGTLSSTSSGNLSITANPGTLPSNAKTSSLYKIRVIASAPSTTGSSNSAFTINALPANPSGTITPAANPACGSTTLTYSAPGASIYWETSAAGTSTTSPTTSNYTLSGTGSIYASAYNGSCWSTGTVNSGSVTINSNPSAPVSGGNDTICNSAAPGIISASSSGNVIDWYAASSNGSALTTASNTYSTSTAGTYYAQARTASTGCVSVSRTGVSLTINSNPSVPVSGGNDTICNSAAPGIISASSSGNVIDWYAASSNGSALTSGSNTYSTSTAGTYYAQARTASTGCVSISRTGVSLTINSNPSAPVSGGNDTICNSAAPGIISASSSGNVIDWYAASSNGSALTSGSNTYSTSTAGTYYAQARTASTGCVSASRTGVSLTINSNPSAPVSGGNDTICNSAAPGIISASSSGNVIDWYAASSNGSALTSGSNTYSTSTAGTYYAQARTASTGCVSASRTGVSLTINSNPSAPVSRGNDTICNSAAPGIISASSSGNVIDWYAASSNGSALTTGSNTYSTSSGNTYYAEARNTGTGCISASRTAVLLTVNANPTAYNVTGGACVPADMGLSNTDVGINYQLYRNSTIAVGSHVAGTGDTIDFGSQNTAGTYSVVATNATTGCTTNMTGVSTVNICTSTWVGSTNNWFADTAWNPAAVPNNCAANVVIPSGLQNYPVVSGADVQVGNVTISAGASITVNRQKLNVCGNWTGGIGANATVTGTGTVYMNSTTESQTLTGNTQFNILQIANTSGNGVNLSSGATVNIVTGLHLQSGIFNVSQGMIHLLSTSSSNNSYIDDFTTDPALGGPFTGTLTGNTVKADRYVPVAGFNQHFISSPVSSPSFSQLGGTGLDGYYVVPLPDCDEYNSNWGSPYGTVFQYNDGHMDSGQCMMGNWQIRSQGNLVNGLGYSTYLNGEATLSLTGAANTGDINVNNLNNSGYRTVSTLQLQPIESGWNLVGNPYPSAIDLTADRSGSGFQSQVQVWQTSGPYVGTWQPLLITGEMGAVVIPPFQSFMVRIDPGSVGPMHSYPFYQSERVRSTDAPFYRTQAQNRLQLALNYNGTNDITTVNFNPLATNSFDNGFDANKPDGVKGRATLYTTMNDNHWYSVNSLPSLAQVATVPMGLHSQATGTMTITPTGIESFDPTTYIFLEDKKTNTWQNLRDGAYTFTTTDTDNQSRFILHFTPPVQILTSDASCSSSGIISINQAGTANWSYTLTDNNSVVISTGALNSGNPVTVSVNAGIYGLALTDNSGYVVMKNIEVYGSQPIVAAFGTSLTAAQVQQSIVFTNSTENAATYSWDFGDGSTGNGRVISHSYLAEGRYTASLTVTSSTGCISSTTQVITVTPRSATGINPLTADGKIRIWSNENKVYVDFTQDGKVEAQVDIFDILGQLLSSEKFGQSTIYSKQIDEMEAVYLIVRVKNDYRITTKKVFIGNK